MGYKKKDRFQIQFPKGNDPEVFFCFHSSSIKEAKEKLKELRINPGLRCIVLGYTPKGQALMKKKCPKWEYLVLKNGKVLLPKKPLTVCGMVVSPEEKLAKKG